MKRYRSLAAAAALGAVLLLAGCSTPDTRIAHDPEAFAQLPADQQALVRAGRVSVGMNMEAVKMALGDPDRITLRTDAQGQTQIWHYVEYAYVDGPYLYGSWGWGGGWGRRGWGGWGGGWGGWGPGWGWDEPVALYDRFQVTFTNGVVSSFRQELPR